MSFSEIWKDFASNAEYVGLVALAGVLLTFYFYRGYHFRFKKLFRKRWGDHPYFEWMAHAYQFGAAWVLLVLVPVIYIKLVLGRDLSGFGVAWGRWGVGLLYVAVAAAAITPGIMLSCRKKSLHREYPLIRELFGKSRGHIVGWEFTYLLYYIPFEFFFRGFIQMGMAPAVGVSLAICFQLFPSVLIHLNKPEEETLAAVGGAFLMGVCVALTGSLVWPILLHWYIGGMTDYFCWRSLGKERDKMMDGGAPVTVP